MPQPPGSQPCVEAFRLADGTEIWLFERRLFHRPDGPAVLHPDGRVEWWYLGEWQDDGQGGRMAADEYVPISPVAIPASVLDVWAASRGADAAAPDAPTG